MKSLIISILLTIPLFSQKTAAVLDFVGKGVAQDEASIVADTVRSDLVSTGAFKVLDRGNMEKILTEQAFQQSGCTDSDCAVQIGQLLNIQYMVIGVLARLGDMYSLTVEFVNVETGEIEKSDRQTSGTIEGMFEISRTIASGLAGREIVRRVPVYGKSRKVMKVIYPIFYSISGVFAILIPASHQGANSIIENSTLEGVLGIRWADNYEYFYDNGISDVSDIISDPAVQEEYVSYRNSRNLTKASIVITAISFPVALTLSISSAILNKRHETSFDLRFVPEIIITKDHLETKVAFIY